jgi:hypothetical protein
MLYARKVNDLWDKNRNNIYLVSDSAEVFSETMTFSALLPAKDGSAGETRPHKSLVQSLVCSFGDF